MFVPVMRPIVLGMIIFQRFYSHEPYDSAGSREEGLLTHACGVSTATGRSRNIGRIVGFKSRDNVGSGMIVKMTGGSECGTVSNGKARLSETTLTLVCDPLAGSGYPVPNRERVQRDECRHELVWESRFACPLCTPSHYEVFYGECENGRQTKIAMWVHNPPLCHDGVPLPPPADVPCDTTLTKLCSPGERYVPEPKEEAGCRACPANHFAVGGGVTWSGQLSSDGSRSMHTTCSSPPCSSMWVSNGSELSTVTGGTSVHWTLNFVRPGIVKFEFLVRSGIFSFLSFFTLAAYLLIH